jgi:hypothetical protein
MSMKKFILGFLVGALLFGSVSAYAASSIKSAQLRNDIKFNVYGTSCTMSAVSIMLDGEKSSTDYVSVKTLSEKMKAEIYYDSQRKTWFIKVPGKKITPDGISNVTYRDGKYYIRMEDIYTFYKNTDIKIKVYQPNPLNSTETRQKLMYKDQVLLDNLPDLIEYDYYVNTILPLIEGAK